MPSSEVLLDRLREVQRENENLRATMERDGAREALRVYMVQWLALRMHELCGERDQFGDWPHIAAERSREVRIYLDHLDPDDDAAAMIRTIDEKDLEISVLRRVVSDMEAKLSDEGRGRLVAPPWDRKCLLGTFRLPSGESIDLHDVSWEDGRATLEMGNVSIGSADLARHIALVLTDWAIQRDKTNA